MDAVGSEASDADSLSEVALAEPASPDRIDDSRATAWQLRWTISASAAAAAL
jgi:hypothetical protein